MAKIGEVLRAYRQKHDITLRQFAKIVGVSNGILCQIEGGKPMAANTMLLLVEWLFGKPKSRLRNNKES